MSPPRVVVVGGGVIGVSCAYYLARAGADVRLLERAHIAAGASRGNAGTISAGHPPLNRPGRLRGAVRQMLDPASPLYIPPRWDPALWSWLVDFARHCTHQHVAATMRVMAPMGHTSLREFDRLVAAEELDCGYRRDGYYDICSSEQGLREASADAELIRPHAYHPELLEADELRRREPALSPDVHGGVYYPEAATVDPLRFLDQLADRARRAGVVVAEGERITSLLAQGARIHGVRTAAGEVTSADVVVLATGPFDLDLLRPFGLRLPVQPGKGYHRDVMPAPSAGPPPRIACVLHETSVFCTPMDGFVRLAGTMELSGHNLLMRQPRLQQLTRAAGVGFPSLASADIQSEWCGLRPMASDGLPIIGPGPGVSGLWVATGHGMLGLTLAPATGMFVAGGVLGGDADPLLERLSPARFARGWRRSGGWPEERRL